jgi:hypothetical protein
MTPACDSTPGVRLDKFTFSQSLACVQLLREAARVRRMTALEEDRLTGWRFVLFNAALAVGNVIALSNVPGYTVLAPYASSALGRPQTI